MEEHETATKIDDEKVEKSTTETTNKAKDTSPTTSSPLSNSNSTWWGGWISQAKEKSASVLEAVKNDLNEITTAVTESLNLVPTEEELNNESNQDPAENSGGVNFTHMKQSISSSISTFFGTVTDALVPQLDEDDTSEAILISNDDTVVLTGFSKHLKELQENDETYLEEPSKTALAEKYRMWLEIVEQDQFTQPRIEKMLQQSQVLNEKYNKFVPDIVSHMNFFKRYLFKRALLEDELASEERTKKEETVIEKQPEPAIVIEASVPIESPPQIKKNEGSGDLDIANYELSEEEQARLLEAYELEIKEREKKGDVFIEPEEPPKVSTKSQKSAKKTLNTQSKSNAAPATSSTSKGKNNKDLKNQQHQPQKSTQQQKSKNPAKLTGNNQTKESESSTSDESWEKDFDM